MRVAHSRVNDVEKRGDETCMVVGSGGEFDGLHHDLVRNFVELLGLKRDVAVPEGCRHSLLVVKDTGPLHRRRRGTAPRDRREPTGQLVLFVASFHLLGQDGNGQDLHG